MKKMSNKVKVIIIAVVIAIIVFAIIIMLSIAGTNKKIEIGDEVFVVSESIGNQAWIVNGTVIEIRYQNNGFVEYSVLLPRNDVVIYGIQENVFLTHKQALKYVLSD